MVHLCTLRRESPNNSVNSLCRYLTVDRASFSRRGATTHNDHLSRKQTKSPGVGRNSLQAKIP